MIADKVNAKVLLLMSAFILATVCGIAAGITFYIFTPKECGGSDLDKSLTVDFADFSIFARYWLVFDCVNSSDCFRADIIQNNTVDMADLSIFAQNWLCEHSKIINVDLSLNKPWMYQNLPGATGSNLIANVMVTNDPLNNSSYNYQWEFVLPSDVRLEPHTLSGDGPNDVSWSFAALNCSQPEGISDSGSAFKVKITVWGNDYGNTGTAEKEFGIALLGDVNNDCIVDVSDRSIINAFWRTGSAGKFTLDDCDLNCDGVVDVEDRSIATAIWRGTICQYEVSSPCPFR